MDQVYEALVHWADAIIIASPIRWGAASSLYFKMAERLNCVQNAVTTRNQVLIRNKVAGFIIVGGQDNIQAVAGQMLGFFAELGFILPAISLYRAFARLVARRHGAQRRNRARVAELAEGARMLAKRCLETAGDLTRACRGARRGRARRPESPCDGDACSACKRRRLSLRPTSPVRPGSAALCRSGRVR